MAKYIYISNNAKKGKLAISVDVFNALAAKAISEIPGITSSKNIKKKDQHHRFHLNCPVETTIHHGIVHVWVAVDVVKGVDLQEISFLIQNKIKDTFLEYTESIPFDFQVKIENII